MQLVGKSPDGGDKGGKEKSGLRRLTKTETCPNPAQYYREDFPPEAKRYCSTHRGVTAQSEMDWCDTGVEETVCEVSACFVLPCKYASSLLFLPFSFSLSASNSPLSLPRHYRHGSAAHLSFESKVSQPATRSYALTGWVRQAFWEDSWIQPVLLSEDGTPAVQLT